MTNAERSPSFDEETTGIRQTVADAERYQNDVDPFIALHTPDAIIVNIAGRRVLGRETLEAAMRQALASPLAQVVTKTEIEDIRFVRPDVAIVSCIKRVLDKRDASTKDAPGSALPSTGSLTYVVVDEPDGWRVALAQTTPVKA